MKRILLTSILVLSAAVCGAEEYHVATTGSDAAPGTDGCGQAACHIYKQSDK